MFKKLLVITEKPCTLQKTWYSVLQLAEGERQQGLGDSYGRFDFHSINPFYRLLKYIKKIRVLIFSNHLTNTNPKTIHTPAKLTGRLKKRKRMTDGPFKLSLGKTDHKREPVGVHHIFDFCKTQCTYSMLYFPGEGKEGETAPELYSA